MENPAMNICKMADLKDDDVESREAWVVDITGMPHPANHPHLESGVEGFGSPVWPYRRPRKIAASG